MIIKLEDFISFIRKYKKYMYQFIKTVYECQLYGFFLIAFSNKLS